SILELLVEGKALFRRRVLAVRELETQEEQVRRLDAEVELVQRQEAADHEPGAGEERQCQRQLGDDERAGPAARADAAGTRATAFLEHLVHVGLRHVKRRRQTEDDAGTKADRGEKCEDAAVYRELDPVRLADVLGHGVEPSDAEN